MSDKPTIASVEDVVRAMAGLKFTSLEIKSDGTVGGTTILVNGKPIKDLDSFRFYFYGGTYGSVGVEFVTRDRSSDPGTFSQTQTFYLIPPIPDKASAMLGAGKMPEELLKTQGDDVQKLYMSM